MDPRERQALIDFVLTVQQVLNFIFRRLIEFPTVHQVPHVQEAWEEVQPKFAQLVDAIQSRDYDRNLMDAGLSGAQLRFKLALFDHAKRAFDQGAQGRWTGMTGRWISVKIKKLLAQLLKAINWLLGSIAHAISIAEPIKEAKEGIEQLLDLEEPEP